MRALYESIERESELQRQLRRTKETLVSTALRLQVAIKVAQEDELTMSSLLAQAEAAKAKEIMATRKVEEAADTINSLSIEVNSLKRRLRALESEKNAGNGRSSSQHFDNINAIADEEVEELFQQDVKSQIPNYIDPAVANAATPFDRWKMNSFLYAPDTPAGSKAHDTHAVQMLLLSSTAEISPDRITRPTLTSVARSRKILSSSQPLSSSASPFSPTTKNPHLSSSAQFFLGNDADQTWGNKTAFDRSNMGRLNLWATTDEPPLSALRESREKQRRTLTTANSATVKLKSLRLSDHRKGSDASPKRSPSPPRKRSEVATANRKILI